MWRKHIRSWLLLKKKKWNGKVEIFIREGQVPEIKDTATDQKGSTIPPKKYFSETSQIKIESIDIQTETPSPKQLISEDRIVISAAS